jgi:hypothetical protein
MKDMFIKERIFEMRIVITSDILMEKRPTPSENRAQKNTTAARITNLKR